MTNFSAIVQVIMTLLTFGVIVVALFGERLWRSIDNKKVEKETKTIIRNNLGQFKKDLVRIRDKRNSGATQKTDRIIFNSTSFSEVRGYDFLFSELLLPNISSLKLSKYPDAIDFFNHYRINMETIKKREEESPGSGALTLGTVNALLDRLEKTLKECS